jgi:hypothetical protein
VLVIVQTVVFWLVTPCSMKIQIIRNKRCSWRSRSLRDLRRRSVAACVLGLGVRITPEAWLPVFCECW